MTDNDSAELQALVVALTGDTQRHKVAYATEGGQFTNSGIPTIICGPGSIEQAHKADEYVKLNEIERCDSFLQRLLESCTMDR
jgi:acetylornithine deacetylase